VKIVDWPRAEYAKRVAVVIPFAPVDEHRVRAFEFVERWYADHYPKWPRAVGTSPAPWSKGLAVLDAINQLAEPCEVLVIADADSFVIAPSFLEQAVEEVQTGRRDWVTPHRMVYRLRPDETERVLAGAKPRLGHTHRHPYEGPIGGGITVVSVAAFERVNGIDIDFRGWGGEDLAFGYALETLAPPGMRLDGSLVHLWHPHPAPDLRGSPESEDLIARYRSARGLRRRMRHLIEHGTIPDVEPVEPVRFRMTANRRTLRLSGGDRIIRFDQGEYTTTDPDEIDALRATGIVVEAGGRPR
jgi:hypothetical protein